MAQPVSSIPKTGLNFTPIESSQAFTPRCKKTIASRGRRHGKVDRICFETSAQFVRIGRGLRRSEFRQPDSRTVEQLCSLLPKENNYSFRQPCQLSGKRRIQKSGVSSLFGKFQGDCERHIVRPRQSGRRHERIVKGIDDERGHFYVFEPRLAAGLLPIVFRISKSMQRRGHEVVELI